MSNNLAEQGIARRQEILDFIIQFITENGYSPSFKEIKDKIHLCSSSTIYQHLRVLERQGIITMKSGQPRTIAVVGYEYRKVE